MILENVPELFGMGYALISLFVLFFLFKSQRFNKTFRYLFLIVTTGLGFLIFAPVLPIKFQNLLAMKPKGINPQYLILILGVLVFLGLTFYFGRIFCGYLCPFGTIQELAYLPPTRKFEISSKKVLIGLHLVVFLVFLGSGIFFSKPLLGYFGLQEFFYLRVSSIFFYVFLGMAILSIFIYRPFCQGICPYGALLSLTSAKSLYKLRRNDKCIDCGLCEEACPTNEAGRGDAKMDCYHCGRCVDVCPEDAIEYSRSN
ncbi:4Fe-4S binding protein [Candidatus Bipolaricaulota bacterium]|nr:4Fe-4S binding protein [Candidatus Bipolaricaulota bacterium]